MGLLPAACDSARPAAISPQGMAAAILRLRGCLSKRRKLLIVIAVGLTAAIEMRFSWLQSRLFSVLVSGTQYTVVAGASKAVPSPGNGPFDIRRGYSALSGFSERLSSQGYEIEEQARTSRSSLLLGRIGISPIYHEKVEAGIDILDRRGVSLHSFRDPRNVYPDFDSIPPLVVRTLLFIENRHLLDADQPNENPAIEWNRLGRAALDYGLHQFDRRHPVIGGSTLATQLEKFRHSPEGRTQSPPEKFRQIATATLRSYQDGPRTLAAQREIICDYINSIPLAATPGFGEISGLGDGLVAWYGVDVAQVNKLLGASESRLSPQQINARGRAYRQVLSLLLALRQPSTQLVRRTKMLDWETDRYLNALTKAGVISSVLRDAALRNRAEIEPATSAPSTDDFVPNKASDAIRAQLMRLLGVNTTYSLDRLDLQVETSIDQTVQSSVTKFLTQLADPRNSRMAGLNEDRLLSVGDPGRVIYSFTLYERGEGVNLLRVQADTLNQPLRIADGTRLQLGSTAKLRTLINYLQIVEELHRRFSGLTQTQLSTQIVAPGDRLSLWALRYLSDAGDRDLKTMLNAALDREYSANPDEVFFTAGGRHVFVNYERSENSRIMTLREAFRDSVNLVFIRLMRDIENYYKWRVPGASPAILKDASHPARGRYLGRFADQEGSVFLRRFYAKYRGLSVDQRLEKLMKTVRPTPVHVAVIFRSARPTADSGMFSQYLKRHVPQSLWGKQKIEDLYEDFAPDHFSLSDRGYLAGIHPLELWLLGYLDQYPEASLQQVIARSVPERQEVYRWLFRPKMRHAQDLRIGIMLEKDAFEEICNSWKRLGYPFDSLTPSYATAIGVSGDTPKALAELAGIIANDGVRYPVETIRRLEFARNTPMQTSFALRPPPGERVLSATIAGLVHGEMLRVVENGTGRRAYRALVLPEGRVVSIAGKTGTGDNRFRVFGNGNVLVAERPVNRTAAFVFILGDRLFGTVMAYVPGQNASSYEFTSALAVQLLKDLAPTLKPLLSQSPYSAQAGKAVNNIDAPR